MKNSYLTHVSLSITLLFVLLGRIPVLLGEEARENTYKPNYPVLLRTKDKLVYGSWDRIHRNVWIAGAVVCTDFSSEKIQSTPLPVSVKHGDWGFVGSDVVFMADLGPAYTAYGFTLVLASNYDFSKKRSSSTRFLSKKAQPGKCVESYGSHMIQLDPINSALRWVQVNKKGGVALDQLDQYVQYGFTCMKGELNVWLYQGTALAGFRYCPDAEKTSRDSGLASKPEQRSTPSSTQSKQIEGIPTNLREWRSLGVFPVKFKGGFSIVYGERPIVITSQGQVYRLSDGKAELMSKLLPGTTSSEPAEIHSDKSEQKDRCVRLVLLELREKTKYVLLRWSGKAATPLDVKGKDKKNIEPFLPAKDVDEKIVKAVTVMMTQRDKDKKEVAELRKKLEEKRKKRLAEEAKKPKSVPLWERLRQNEKGK